MAPSVTPKKQNVGSNNPGLRLYKFETDTGQVSLCNRGNWGGGSSNCNFPGRTLPVAMRSTGPWITVGEESIATPSHSFAGEIVAPAEAWNAPADSVVSQRWHISPLACHPHKLFGNKFCSEQTTTAINKRGGQYPNGPNVNLNTRSPSSPAGARLQPVLLEPDRGQRGPRGAVAARVQLDVALLRTVGSVSGGAAQFGGPIHQRR